MNPVDPWEYIKQQQIEWQKLGYNPNMTRKLPTRNQNNFSPGELDQIIDRSSFSADKLGTIAPSNILSAIAAMVRSSGTGSASVNLLAGEAAVMTSTLKDNLDINRIMLATFHVTPFQGSVANANVIPYGSGVDPANWLWETHLDWSTNNNRYASAVHYLKNISAGALDVIWETNWRYIGRIGS